MKMHVTHQVLSGPCEGLNCKHRNPAANGGKTSLIGNSSSARPTELKY